MEAKKTDDYDCIATQCNYRLPHYHCKIPNCRIQINIGDDDKRDEFHPCCSEEHIKIYNEIYFCSNCGNKLDYPEKICIRCDVDDISIENNE